MVIPLVARLIIKQMNEFRGMDNARGYGFPDTPPPPTHTHTTEVLVAEIYSASTARGIGFAKLDEANARLQNLF